MTGRYRPHLSLREGLEQPPRSGAEKPRFSNPFYSRAPFPLINSHPFGSARSSPGREAAKRTLDGEDRSGIIQGEGKGGMQISQ